VEKVLAEKPLNTQPWFMHWVFQAIYHAGLFDQYGTPQMRRWNIVPQTQSFHEMWNGGDLSHGWCSTPLVQMSAHVLGVTPSSPGFKTIAIQPHLCDLTWAKGRVPTPHGDVAVSWTRESGKFTAKFTLEVDVPTGCEADVTLPAGLFAKPTIHLDGRRAAAKAHVSSGIHRFEVTGKPTLD
jgi:alpha-L-rhamnosidase